MTAILLPLGIGFGMAVPIYNEFVDVGRFCNERLL